MDIDTISKALAQFSRKQQPKLPLAKLAVGDAKITAFKSCKQKRSLIDSDKAGLCVVKRAEEVRSLLDPQFPSFVKPMRPSHVSSCFWLGLPNDFCKSYLPKEDTTFILVNEDEGEYNTKYLAEKTGLSGGWRGFSIAHNLVEGDVLIFYLVEATKFKVYIIRAHAFDEVNEVLGLPSVDLRPLRIYSGNCTEVGKKPAPKRPRVAANNVISQSTSPTILDSELELPIEQSENSSEEVSSDGSDVLEGIRFSGTIIEFKDMGTIESFSVAVNGLIIDSEFSNYVRSKYYGLCCSQKAFLHEHLLEGINCKLVAGIICQTVTIADAIRASKLSTSQDEFESWDTCLSAFGQLGMNVGFLRSRLKQLVSFAAESDKASRYKKAVLGKSIVEKEIELINEKLLGLHETSEKFETEINYLEGKEENHEYEFQADANAPW
ncbi:hypothetical protein GIB67_010715 [Kingdonia uniflora]|uniref:TF-B3 domain-containing protein n=1 Tax=Kingdonia uniflora TaxID=39325 RepID=A0A7J7L8U8_9MAGN|nr:hypothetical protein GIB67_010715 [Kingdonia uniflora]